MTTLTRDLPAAPAQQLPPGKVKQSGGDRAVSTTAHILLIIWMLIVLIPFLWVLMSSFKTSSQVLSNPMSLPTSLHWANYYTAWEQAGIGKWFLNTVIVVGCSLVIVMVLGAMCAYVLARFTFPGNRLVYYSMLAGLTFPIFLAIVPLFFTLKNLGLINTLPGLIMTYVAFALPFTVFFLHSFFAALPKEIYEASQVDGASEWRTFFQVMLPMAKPGMAAVSIFNFLGLWNQFLLPVALNAKPDNYVLTQGMASFASSAGYAVDFGSLFAAVVITIVPVLVVYVIFQRQLQGSVSQSTIK
ncbi:MAG: sugar ABC transporter permease [Actinobacteria bacterium 69-20]|nr:carbohydrate ABC transporter permease [Actinomycetota bacterium]OJV26687.1 MAG: sugar ABC transporter permease [Actinobacteria bacterium 69-20]